MNLATLFKDERGEGMSEDEERLLSSDGKAFWVRGHFQGLLLGLKTDSDLALEVKEDAIKVEVTIASWLFFPWVIEDWDDNGVAILGEGFF